MNENNYIANINKLSKGRSANCGEYGIVECVKAASESRTGTRLFKVSKSTRIPNRGNYTLGKLRSLVG